MLIDLIPDSTSYKLNDNNILSFSETVLSDSIKFVRDINYRIDYQSGLITIIKEDIAFSQISISYFVVPDFLMGKYFLYQVHEFNDSLTLRQGFKRKPFVLDKDNKLIISGSKTFAISFSNQDTYDIKQSLFIKLEGELSDNVKIEGQLSDSQSPLSPEGDSREISNIDQVYLKIYSDRFATVLGDQEWNFNKTLLIPYKFKFEGINAWYNDKFSAQGAITANSGKRLTNRINGIDGKQGPYFLTTNSIGQSSQIIPGSESVSIDGSTISRGTDYYIDYADGSITFVTLVTSNSTIIVDFQYTDDYYNQNMYINSSEVPLTQNLTIRHHLIWQRDNKNHPLLWSFSQADKDSLSEAGDNDVRGQGIFEVSAGSGSYKRLNDVNNREYYVYSPNDSTAIFLVYFSFVGTGQGDYEPLTTTAYKYVGTGLGSYLPFKSLVAPKEASNLSLGLQYQVDGIDVYVEGMFTNQDRNTFSSIDDSDNQSFVTKTAVKHVNEDLFFKPEFALSHFYKGKHSYTFANLNSAQDSYDFSSLENADSISLNQIDFSFNSNFDNKFKQNILLRYQTQEEFLEQKAAKFDTYIKQSHYLPMLGWYGLFSKQDYKTVEKIDYDQSYHKLQSEWKWRWLTLNYNQIIQEFNYYPDIVTAESLLGNSFHQSNPAIKLSNNKSMTSSISYSNEENKVRQDKHWKATKESESWKVSQIINNNINSIDFSLIHRNINDVTSDTESRKSYDLLSFKSNHQWFDNSINATTSYQLNQMEFFPKIRELQYVGNGMGLYDSTGVQVSSGDYDYVYVNSGKSQMSTEINAGLNLMYHLSHKYKWHWIWTKFHVGSEFQIIENTMQRNDMRLYLLYPDELFNSSSTLYGRQSMNHNLWIDLWQNKLSANIKYEVNKTLDNRYDSLDRSFSNNNEIELTWKNVFAGQLRTSYQNRFEKNSRYNSAISSDLFSGLFYKNIGSQINTQTSLILSKEDGKNQTQDDSYEIYYIKLNPSLTVFWQNKYRITSSMTTQFNKRSGSDFLTYLPDKRNGLIFLWSLQTQYKITSFSSGSLIYSVKSYPKDEVVHELKMEFKAEL